jgi:hypothetical protein
MAASDGETPPQRGEALADVERHAASCASCAEWVREFQAMSASMSDASYQDDLARVDLWPSVAARIRPSAPAPGMQRLWLIGVAVLAWRLLELMFDLPLPGLHPLVPLAAAALALKQIAGDPFAIETFPSELYKRGI